MHYVAMENVVHHDVAGKGNIITLVAENENLYEKLYNQTVIVLIFKCSYNLYMYTLLS